MDLEKRLISKFKRQAGRIYHHFRRKFSEYIRVYRNPLLPGELTASTYIHRLEFKVDEYIFKKNLFLFSKREMGSITAKGKDYLKYWENALERTRDRLKEELVSEFYSFISNRKSPEPVFTYN